MPKEAPDHHDAEIVLRLYELRREAVMRESRAKILAHFWPRGFDDLLGVTKMDHPMNAAWRQVSSYWEMVYGMAKHGIAHADYLVENSGEGLFLYAKVHPFLDRFRAEMSPVAFRHAQWAAENTTEGQRIFGMFRKRVEGWHAANPPA